MCPDSSVRRTKPGRNDECRALSDLSIASVTLADDCGTGPTAEPPVAEAGSMQQPAGPAGERESMSKGSARASMSGDRACEQSSVQLRVANGTTAASAISIKKVEVLTESGDVIGELQWRTPSRWVDDAYQAWDEQVAPSQVLQVSYSLTAPGPVLPGSTYTVRVTVAAGDGERTIETKTTLQAEASLPPGAVT